MTSDAVLRAHGPDTLGRARAVAHLAAQLPARAAVANLAAAPDDSHTNLGWDAGGKRFLTQPIPAAGGPWFVGLTLSPLRLSLEGGSGAAESLPLENVPLNDAVAWLDARLAGAGLVAASSAELAYELPSDVAGLETFETGGLEELATLAGWFDFAHVVLSDFAAKHHGLAPGPSAVRCWPHHFDIATYVGLEDGDFETARGIGVGMSPGDDAYGQPYFYVNPWPHLGAGDLPALPPPGHWHTEGLVGAVATGDEVLSLDDPQARFPSFVGGAFDIGRKALGV